MRICTSLLFLGLWAFAGSAVSQLPADAGIVTLVSGGVKMVTVAGVGSVPKPFSRIQANDRFVLGSGATIRILNLQTGNSALWSGPGEFSVGVNASGSALKPVAVQQLPAKAHAKLQAVSKLSNNLQLGGTTVRSIRPARDAKSELDADQLAEIRDTYNQLLRQFPGNDITPEVFLSMSIQQYLSGPQ